MTSRKHPPAAFWISAALVAVLVAYPLSIGPVCWITSRIGIGNRTVPAVYRPIIWACWRNGGFDKPIGRALYWYSLAGASVEWNWTVNPAVDDAGKVVGEILWIDCSIE